jgi:hypothetical protein
MGGVMDMLHTAQGSHRYMAEEGHGARWSMAMIDDSMSGARNFKQVAPIIQ